MKEPQETIQSHIEVARASDIDGIMRVERQSFGVDAYVEDEFLWLRRMGRETFLVARKYSKIVGYIAAYMAEGNGYIASVAVAPSYRQHGIGAALISAVRQRLLAKGAAELTLHTRQANQTAVRLYEQQGFAAEATVPSYYEDGESALYMKLRM